MPDGRVRGMPRPVPTTAGGIVLPQRLYNPLGTEVYKDEFDDASIDGGWTRVDVTGNSSHVTWTESNGMMSFYHNLTTETGPRGHYLLRDISSLGGPPLTIEVRARGMMIRNVSYLMLGLALSDSTTYDSGTQIVWMPYVASGTGVSMNTSIRRFTGFNVAQESWTVGVHMTPYAPTYVRLIWSSANNFSAEWSSDGINWLTSGTKNWTCSPTYAGFFVSNWSNARIVTAAWDYFRVYDTDPPAGEVKDTL